MPDVSGQAKSSLNASSKIALKSLSFLVYIGCPWHRKINVKSLTYRDLLIIPSTQRSFWRPRIQATRLLSVLSAHILIYILCPRQQTTTAAATATTTTTSTTTKQWKSSRLLALWAWARAARLAPLTLGQADDLKRAHRRWRASTQQTPRPAFNDPPPRSLPTFTTRCW